jgi:fatty-acyl-CoA synthase
MTTPADAGQRGGVKVTPLYPDEDDRPELQLAYWPSDNKANLVDFTVGGLLSERVRTHADRVALIGVGHGDSHVVRRSYAELYDDACRVATALAALAEPGSFVALWAPNVAEWPLIQFGAALAGVVLVALNPALRQRELEYALKHSGASILIHADSNGDYDMAGVVSQLGARLPDLRCVSLSSRAGWLAEKVDASVVEHAPADPDEVVMLQYTSGTTGSPKGVLLTHKSLINDAKLTFEAVDVDPGATCLNPLPMFHTAGCVIATLGPVWIGGTIVLIERFRPTTVLDTCGARACRCCFSCLPCSAPFSTPSNRQICLRLD